MVMKPSWSPQGAIAPVNGWSGLYNHVYNEQYQRIDSQNVRRGFALSVRNWGRFAYNQTIKAFITGTVGTTALAQGRWVASQDPNDALLSSGGVRGTVLHTAMNRAVTVADQTAIQQDLSMNNRPTWPLDKGGNGGGGKGGGL